MSVDVLEPTEACEVAENLSMSLAGYLDPYLRGVVDQWALIAPRANPGMLEMFRDRDVIPLRPMVPWAGEFAGKYLTASVQMLRVTGDDRLRKWLQEYVARLVSLQADDGYLGPWPKRSRLTASAPNCDGLWDAWGHYHVMMGLLLWHEETKSKDSLNAACRIADLLCRKFLGKKKVRLVETNWSEMNLAPAHVLALLHKKTGNERYLALALQIVDEFGMNEAHGAPAGNYLNAALEGKEFWQIPKPRWESLHPMMVLKELFLVTGEGQYKQAFEHWWWSMVKLDRHNHGGFTCGEKATGNPYQVGSVETCCTIAWMAYSVEMLKLSGNSLVADELELSTMNSIVGAHSETGRWATYDTPSDGLRYASAHHINFQGRPGTPELNCCSVNSNRGFGMLSDWALMKDGMGLALNWYGPSTLKTKLRSANVQFIQETRYPAAGRIRIRVDPSRSIAFPLKLRIPQWSKRTRVSVNGKTITPVVPGQYLCVDRKWKKGDEIELSLDMSPHLWVGEKDVRGKASIYRGPILLTYDRRYNLEHHERGGGQHQDEPLENFDAPILDARKLRLKKAKWKDWEAPFMLFQAVTANGKTICLCDFGSAGYGGSVYRSWLPVKNMPSKARFSKQKTLRTAR
jgi:DUF1680 family protein